MAIRKLFFRAQSGEQIPLDGTNGIYAADLSGLGLSLTPSYADLGRGFFTPVSRETEPQSAVAFTLVFTCNPYAEYTRLINWLAAAESLQLVYRPAGGSVYYRDVDVNFIQKGELTAVGWLECPSSFLALTPWYNPVPVEIGLGQYKPGENKRYAYRYSANLRYGADSTASMSGTISGGGHIPSAMSLTYRGAITNPKIRLTGNISGKTYGICSVETVLVPSDTLVLSTRYNNSYVKRISASGEETDLLDALDLSTDPFFRVPITEPCTISVEAGAVITGRADLLIYYYYRSV